MDRHFYLDRWLRDRSNSIQLVAYSNLTTMGYSLLGGWMGDRNYLHFSCSILSWSLRVALFRRILRVSDLAAPTLDNLTVASHWFGESR